MTLALLLAATAATTPLTVRGDRIFLPARFNGVATEAVLDSAAEASFVDDGFARRIGAERGRPVVARGSGGAASAHLVKGARIEAAGLTLDGLTIGVTDLDDVGERLFGHSLDAIVGRELFDAARLSIDIEKGCLAVLPRRNPPRGKMLKLSSHHGIETLPVSIEGDAPVWAEFDLGNGSEVSIGRAYAKRLGLLAPERIVAREEGGGIGGKVKRDVVVLKTLKLAGVTFRDVRATIDAQPNAADANIGVKLLRHFRIVTDFAQKAVWLQPRHTEH
jgi:predicted aspartyl protease